MRDKDNISYFKAGITLFCVVIASIICYFFLSRWTILFGWVKGIMRIMRPIVYGIVLAYILTPSTNFFQDKINKLFKGNKEKLAAGLSITISVIILLVAVSAVVMLIVPQLVSSITSLIDSMSDKVIATNAWFSEKLADKPHLQEMWNVVADRFNNFLSEENLTKFLNEKVIPLAQKWMSSMGYGALGIAYVLKDIIIGIIVCVYCLIDRKKFAAQGNMVIYSIFPQKWADMLMKELHYADLMVNGFLTGKLLDSLIIGLICFICMMLIGLPMAPLISTIIGITNIIPVFGPFIGAVPCALLLLIEKPIFCLYFVIFVLILQQIDGNIIGPKILGNTTGLSSFWVLFSIILFGGKWGIFGMLIGVPLWAVIYDILGKLIARGLWKKGKSDLMTAYQQEFDNPQDRLEKNKDSFSSKLIAKKLEQYKNKIKK